MQEPSNSRNFGIDLLRLVAMFYVVTLHSIGPGGILAAAAVDSVQYHGAWLMEIWTYCAVDIFALISGYVGYSHREKPVKPASWLLLWLQVVTYGAGVALAFHLFRPDLVTRQDFFFSLFPLTNGLYWYVTAYTGLFLLMPLLNAGLRALSESSSRILFLLLFAAFSLFDIFFTRFTLGGGYSFVWITLLYLMGGCIKKCGIGKHLKVWQAFLWILALCLFTWWWKMSGPEFDVFKTHITRDQLVSYVSPTVLGAAVLHLIGFSRLEFGPGCRRLISFAAPAAFAVYILNCNKLIWAHLVANKFTLLAGRPLWVMAGCVLGFSLLFVILSVLLDRLRILLFRLCRIPALAHRFTGLLGRGLSALANRL